MRADTITFAADDVAEALYRYADTHPEAADGLRLTARLLEERMFPVGPMAAGATQAQKIKRLMSMTALRLARSDDPAGATAVAALIQHVDTDGRLRVPPE